MLKYLIEKGAYFNIKNNEGKTALDFAKTKEVKELFIKSEIK